MIFHLAVVVVLLFVFAAKWMWGRRKLYMLSWKMPGPLAFPFVGSALSLIYKEKLKFIEETSLAFEKLNSPIRIWLGTKLFVYVDNVEDVEVVLSSTECTNREEIYQYLKEALGVNGVFTLEGNMWKHHRRLVSPSFNYSVVISYLPTFNKNCAQLIECLGRKVGKPTFNIREVIVHTTLDLFLEATFGAEMENEDKIKFRTYMAEGQRLVAKRMFAPWFHIDFIWKLTKYPARLREFRKFAKTLIETLLEDKLLNGSAHVTFLERLLRVSQENEDFSLEDVRAEATNTLAAAADTSGWSIAFTLLMLAMHPEVQENVIDELRSIFSTKESDVNRADIEKMFLLERCINESMRLFPVVTLMARKCETPMKLNDFIIEPGTAIAIGVQQIHRKTKYWGSEAHLFNPDNFLPNNIAGKNPFCFIPFSGGPRNCIGTKYAMTVMKVILAHILRNYRISTPLKLEELEVRMDVNIFLINGHMVQVHHRDF